MASTRHTATARHMIYYHFICEHCGKFSGIIIRKITGSASKSTSLGRELEIHESAKLGSEATSNCRDNLMKEKKCAESGDYSNFNGKCPHCGKYQSWANRGFYADVFRMAFNKTIGLGFLVGFVEVFRSIITEEPFRIFVEAMAVLAVAFVLFFLYHLLRWLRVRRNTTGVEVKRLPVIEWNGLPI